MIWGCHYFWKHQFSWLTQGFPYMKIDCFRSLGQFFLTAMAKKTCGCELKVSFFQMNMDMKFHMSTWPKFKQTHGKPLLESHCISQTRKQLWADAVVLEPKGYGTHTHTHIHHQWPRGQIRSGTTWLGYVHLYGPQCYWCRPGCSICHHCLFALPYSQQPLTFADWGSLCPGLTQAA